MAAMMSLQGLVPFAILFGVLVVCFIPGFFMLFTMAALFAKAGQPGWGAVVPVYNGLLMLRVAGKPWWWLLLSPIPVFPILALVGTARNFGKGVGFAIGLLFLPFVFYPVLAFGNARWSLYVPEEPEPEEESAAEAAVDAEEDAAAVLAEVEVEEKEEEEES